MAAIPRPTEVTELAALREALDEAPPALRLEWLRGLSRRDVLSLYDLAVDGGPVRATDLAGAEGRVVVHQGRNSLPFFRAFQKRFCLRGGVVQGYNHNSSVVTWFGGPGHFTCAPDGDGLLFDYTAVPADVPPGFPPLRDNDHGTRKLVFGGMRDLLRKVSRHCLVGTAMRNGRPEGQGFVLVREGDPGEDDRAD